MENDHFVIIGNGPAGNRAAEVIRAEEPDSRVTIIADEPQSFYYRHKLPAFIAGKCDEADLVVRDADYYKERNIRLRLGQRVVRLDVRTRTLFLEHMEKVHYSRLLLCVGGGPRIPEVHHQYQDHFVTMTNWPEAVAMRKRLAKAECIVMAGGDLVSLQMARCMLTLGKRVVFIIDADSFWPLELTEERREEVTASLREHGAEVIADDVVAQVAPVDEGYLVTTRNGHELNCDLVGAFYGLNPRTDFIMRSGLDVERGVLVDETLKTSVDGIYAAGDCAEIYHPDLRSYWVSIGWANAQCLGGTAALNMLGEGRRVDRPPTNAIDVEGLSVNTSWWKEL